jgi:hypothetical protein
MMYSFDNREDCYSTDEPLYANFLQSTGTPHPGAQEVIASHETDLEVVISHLTGPIPNRMPIWYQKHMCHHVMDDADISWIDGLANCFLIRNPRDVLISLSKITDSIDLRATGLPQQIRIFDYVSRISGRTPPIVDSEEILVNPSAVLAKLCEAVGVPFTEKMLSWKPGPRNCDGIWAKNWYDSVWATSGFIPSSHRAVELSAHLSSVFEEAMPIYRELREMRIRV